MPNKTAHNRLVVAFLILSLVSAGSWAFSRVSGTSFAPTISVGQGFVDTQGNFLYFPLAGMKPGGLTRIRLSDFSLGGESFSLAEEIDSGSMVIDPAARAAYVTGTINPGRIVKFNLDSYQRTAGLALNGGKWPALMGIDTARGLAWALVFGGTTDGRLVKLRLSDFSETVPFLDLPDPSMRSLAVDTATATGYYVARDAVSKVVKLDLLSMTKVAEIALEPGEDVDKVAIVDRSRDALYLAGDAGTKLVRLRLSTFQRVDALSLPANGAGVVSGALDPNGAFLYLGRGGSQQQLVRVALDSFQVLPSMTLGPGERALAMAMDPRDRTLYLTVKDRPAAVTKIALAGFTRGLTLSHPLGISHPGQIIHDPARPFVYFATDTQPHSVAVSVDLSDYAVRTLSLAPLFNSKTGFLDPNGLYVYFVNCFVPTRIARVRISDWTLDGTLVLNNTLTDATLIWTSVVDPVRRRAFLASSGASPGGIAVIDLDSFTHVVTHRLPGFLSFRAGGVYGDAAYFLDGINGSGRTSIARVAFDDLSLTTAAIQTPFGNLPATAGGFDEIRGFAYFTGGNQISQVRLSDFTETARLTHPGIGGMTFQSLATDAGRNAGYAGTAGAPGVVIRFGLSPFQFTGVADGKSPEGWFWSGAIDKANNAAYFTDYGWRSGLVKFNLAEPIAPPAPPAAPRVTIARARSVRAHWGTVPEAETYEFSASRNPGLFPMPKESEGVSETGIGDIAGLTPGTTYHLFVRACNSMGCSAFVPFGPFDTATGPPGGGRVIGALTSSLTAEWSPTASASSYTLAASRTPANPPAPPAASSATLRTEAALGGLAPNTRYHLFVNACDGGTCSDYLAIGSSATLANRPDLLSAQSAGGNAVRLALAANGNPPGTLYQIEASADGGLNFAVVAAVTGLTPVLSNLASRTPYLLRARGLNLDGIPTAYSAASAVTTGQGEARLYPNPFKPGGVPLNLDGLAPESPLRIFTPRGELVREIRADAGGIAVWDGKTDGGAPVAAGVFLVMLKDSRGVEKVLKLAVQR